MSHLNRTKQKFYSLMRRIRITLKHYTTFAGFISEDETPNTGRDVIKTPLAGQT